MLTEHGICRVRRTSNDILDRNLLFFQGAFDCLVKAGCSWLLYRRHVEKPCHWPHSFFVKVNNTDSELLFRGNVGCFVGDYAEVSVPKYLYKLPQKIRSKTLPQNIGTSGCRQVNAFQHFNPSSINRCFNTLINGPMRLSGRLCSARKARIRTSVVSLYELFSSCRRRHWARFPCRWPDYWDFIAFLWSAVSACHWGEVFKQETGFWHALHLTLAFPGEGRINQCLKVGSSNH